MLAGKRSVRVALVQEFVAPDLPTGLQLTRARTAESVAGGAALVVFPETWLPGYPAWLDVTRDAALWDHEPVKAAHAEYARNSVVIDGESGRELAAIARDHAVVLVVGVSERVSGGPGHGTLYNSLLTFGPDGRLLNHHRKLVPTYTERLVWGAGDADGLRTMALPDASTPYEDRPRLGGLICWEHWMPLARQALHDAGEDIHVAVWPTVHEQHQWASRHYAFEGRCYVLAVGGLMRAGSLPPGLELDPERVPDSGTLVLCGGSAVIAPDGSWILEPLFDEPAIRLADLDLDRIRAERMTLDVSGHYHRPDLFELKIRRDRRGVDD